jgi:hypothetical protein
LLIAISQCDLELDKAINNNVVLLERHVPYWHYPAFSIHPNCDEQN